MQCSYNASKPHRKQEGAGCYLVIRDLLHVDMSVIVHSHPGVAVVITVVGAPRKNVAIVGGCSFFATLQLIKWKTLSYLINQDKSI